MAISEKLSGDTVAVRLGQPYRQSTLGAAAGVLGVPVALISGALICAAINVGIFAQRSDLRAREMGTAADTVIPSHGGSEPAAATRGCPDPMSSAYHTR